MKTKISVWIVLFALFISGCATSFRPWNMEKLESGMSRADVIELLGEPNSTETLPDGQEQLIYEYSESMQPLAASQQDIDDIPRFEERVERHGQKKIYRIVLSGGVVKEFGRVE